MSYKHRLGEIGTGNVGQAQRRAYRRQAKLLVGGTLLALAVGLIVVLTGVAVDSQRERTATAAPPDAPRTCSQASARRAWCTRCPA